MSRPLDLAPLRAAAAAATQGEWRVNGYAVVADEPAPGIKGSDDVAHYGGHLIGESINHPNAAYIAMANPATMLAVLDRLTAAEARVESAEAVGYARGVREAALLFGNPHTDERRIIVGKVDLSCAEARHVAAAILALLPTTPRSTPDA